jgi:hypothetical protein
MISTQTHKPRANKEESFLQFRGFWWFFWDF